MIVLNVLLALCSVHPLVTGFRGYTFQSLENPKPLTEDAGKNIVEGLITQPLDHFNHRDNRTWSMRYKENSAFLKEGGPILILIGGEWEITNGFLQSGLMYEIGVKYGGLMYYTEHRFYGKSKPTSDTSTENLQYLNVDQALADLAYFIETKKKEKNLENRIVIVFGCSYAGNMAAWARLKYPHLIQGALASSAPIQTKLHYDYYEVMMNLLGRYSEDCVENIKAAFEEVKELLDKDNGPIILQMFFNLCHEPNVNSSSELNHLIRIILDKIVGAIHHESKINGGKIANLCNIMTKDSDSPLERLWQILSIQEIHECHDANYDNFVKKHQNTSWDSAGIIRPWFYQLCMEFGYFPTTSDKYKSIFGTLLSLDFYIDQCIILYGVYHDKKILESRIKRADIMYGGRLLNVRNVIFTNGDMDPWHLLSVLKDLNVFSPAIVIKGASHCNDMYSDEATDSDDLRRARARIRDEIDMWITYHNYTSKSFLKFPSISDL